MFLASLLLSPLFSDHMVLQRDQANPVWGKDNPGQLITLRVMSQTAKAPLPEVQVKADADGTWRLNCPALPCGGPYKLKITGSTERMIDDVLVGEVWLASGQSNMEWKLTPTEGGKEAVANSTDEGLRMFTVGQTYSLSPQSALTGAWEVSSPKTSPGFSAVGYHFAKELRRHLGVPVGILHSSWGGTRVEAWTSTEALRAVYPVDAELAELAEQNKNRTAIETAYAEQVLAWETKNFPQDVLNQGEQAGWQKSDALLEGWTTFGLPSYWQTQGMLFNGCAWFRRAITIPASWEGRELTLELGVVDDFDITYFNGEQVGATPHGTPNAYKLPRVYKIPASLVKAGTATLAVRVFDQFGEGGFGGPVSSMRIHPSDTEEALSLAGDWLMRVEREVPTVPGSVYATSPVPPALLQGQNNPAALYNGMIAPLLGYGMRGALWYQGEANVGVAEHYRDRLVAMIRDWRARWGQGDFDFLEVQLANYQASPDWAELREAQTQILNEPATGMALAIDIGNPNNIHPANKAEVGRRLALLARRNSYGETALEAEGPSLRKTLIRDGKVRVLLNHAKGLRLRAQSTGLTGFEVAGSDGVYHSAEGRIEGESLLLWSTEVPAPHTVRYAWASSPEVSIENGAGLPAQPFRTDTQAIQH